MWPNLAICEKSMVIVICSTKWPNLNTKKFISQEIIDGSSKSFFVFFLKSSMTNTNKNLRHCVKLKISYGQAREGNSFTLFVSPHLGGGYPYPIMLCNITQNAMGQTPGGGTMPGPVGGGYPAGGTLPRGYPGRVTPQVGYPPPARSDGGVPS